MKLSEAIRLGAMIVPQAHGSFTDGRGGEACALMSAIVAVKGLKWSEFFLGIMPDNDHDSLIAEICVMFPIANKLAAHPVNAGECDSLAEIIIGLNDEDDWTREAIADWVESIEPKPITQVKTQELEVVLV